MAFQAGYDKYASWKHSTAAGYTTLFITGHSWAEMVDKLDVTHTGTSGVQALIAGILRGDGNIKANLDSAVIVNADPLFIRAGQKGVMALYLGHTNPFLIPGMITKVNYQTVVEGKVEYNFDVSLDALGGTTYTYPSN